MSTLEREIIEKFHQLDKDAQKRVRALIDAEIHAAEAGSDVRFDYNGWLQVVETLRGEMRSHHGGVLPAVDVVGLLRDIRDGEDE